MLKRQFLETRRGRIAAFLQRGGRTADEIATQLRLTPNAVRAQLQVMERDGLVRRGGHKKGTTRPSSIFELTAEVEQLLSGAYIPLLTHLLRVLTKGSRPAEVRNTMRQVGRSLARDLVRPARGASTLEARVNAANDILLDELGAVTTVARRNGGYVITGAGCPLAGLTDKHPSVCLVIESLVREIVGAPVHECCDRAGRPRCCFEIGGGHRDARGGASAARG
jgi:predicted ArsR family transcriptional regulator